ncbi:hypothetical protein T4D_8956, partial [Trichinella pseudospiralis]
MPVIFRSCRMMNFRRFEQQQRSSVIGNDCCRRLCRLVHVVWFVHPAMNKLNLPACLPCKTGPKISTPTPWPKKA